MQMWLKVKGLVHVCLAPSLGEHAVECAQTSESICHLLNAASVAGAVGIDSDAA